MKTAQPSEERGKGGVGDDHLDGGGALEDLAIE